MNDVNNPSLRQIPRHEYAELIPSRHDTSMLDWLRSSGRLIPRDDNEKLPLREEDEFILLGDEDDSFDDVDDSMEEDL